MYLLCYLYWDHMTFTAATTVLFHTSGKSVIALVCRVMRELEAVKQEALMLQDQMKTIKYDIQKVHMLWEIHENV